MKKMKYIVFFIILSSVLMLLNIKIYAIENKDEDVINAIPDVIEINDSKEESIEKKLNEIQIPNEYEIKILSTNNYWSVNIGLKLKNKDEFIIQKAIKVDHTCDLIEKILEIIPSNVNINIPEIEYDDEKSNKLVENEIEKVLRENKILIEDLEKNNIEISTFIHPLYLQNGVKSAELFIKYNGSNVKKGNKNINVIYNNTNQYNQDDEKYIKDFEIVSNKYYEVGLNYLKSDVWKNIAEDYEKQIGDKTVKVKVEIGAAGPDGALNLGVDGNLLYVGIFKNEILYEIRRLELQFFVPVVNVPSTISDEKINNYVTNEIIKCYPELENTINEIQKGTGELNIKDGYTVKTTEGKDSYIIIRKNTKTILNDENTKIKLEATVESVPEDTKLIVKYIKDNEKYDNVKKKIENKTVKFNVYDVSLLRNNILIQPNGNVKISLPIPEGYNHEKLAIYGINNDKVEEYGLEIQEGFAIFETNHLSTYILAEKIEDNSIGEIDQIEEKNEENKLDNTPKTGNQNIEITMSYILSMISSIGIICIKRIF